MDIEVNSQVFMDIADHSFSKLYFENIRSGLVYDYNWNYKKGSAQ